MLIALLSARERVSDEDATPLVALPAPGGSVLRRQVEFALAFGCKRIICLADGPSKALIQLQLVAERGGADFIIAQHNRKLAGSITSADRLIVMAEGLVFAADDLTGLPADKSAILALPENKAVALGYERIDRERAWAGIMVLRGALVEKLHDLPDDIDCISSLLRLGLQSAAPIAMIDQSAISERRWELLGSIDAMEQWQQRAAANALSPSSWSRPIYRLIDHLVLARAGKGRDTPWAPTAFRLASILMAAVSLVSVLYGLVAVGFAIAVFAAIGLRIGRSLSRVSRGRDDASGHSQIIELAETLIVDLVLATGIVLSAGADMQVGMAFAAAMLFGSLHLSAVRGNTERVLAVQDRALLAMLLALATIFGLVSPIVQLFAVFALASELFIAARARLTSV